MAFAITNAREEPSVRWNGPSIAKTAKPARLLWTLLALHMLASLVFLVVNLSALHAERFPDQNAVEWPFAVAQDGATVATVTPEARQGGLSPGDVIESLNGE